MTSPRLSNRLPTLAAEIRRAHADVYEAATVAAQRAIDAGHALIEAKGLVQHGEWLPWLREHCALAERSAQLYMKIARSGLESATVADLGLKGAAETIILHIDYWSDLSQPELIEWRVFALFLTHHDGWHIQSAFEHTEWLRRGCVGTPSEWLFGESGNRFRLVWYRRELPQAWLNSWCEFLDANRQRTLDDIEAEMSRISDEQGIPQSKGRKRRPRRAMEVAP
jgi:hypothetical protein